MDENLLVLLEPTVDLVPVDATYPERSGVPGSGFGVAPHGILDPPVADHDRPVGRLTPLRGQWVDLSVGSQQIEADVLSREVVDG